MNEVEVAAHEVARLFQDRYFADDIGSRFTCSEAEVIAELLLATSGEMAAQQWLRAHAQGDDDIGDLHRDLLSDPWKAS